MYKLRPEASKHILLCVLEGRLHRVRRDSPGRSRPFYKPSVVIRLPLLPDHTTSRKIPDEHSVKIRLRRIVARQRLAIDSHPDVISGRTFVSLDFPNHREMRLVI